MELGRHQGMMTNEHIRVGSNSYKKVKTFKYLGSLLTNKNYIQDEIECRVKAVHNKIIIIIIIIIIIM